MIILKERRLSQSWMIVARAGGIFACCVSVGACVWEVDIEVDGGLSSPTFTLSKAGPLGRSPGCVSSVDLASNPGTPLAKEIWGLDAENSKCITLRSLKYGASYPGLSEKKPAVALSPDVPYELAVRGWGWGGNCKFIFQGGRYRKWTWKSGEMGSAIQADESR